MTTQPDRDRDDLSRRDMLKLAGGVAVLAAASGCEEGATVSSASAALTGSRQLIDPLHYSSASALAAGIREGRISSSEVVEACLARIEQVNPALNAVVQLRAEEARADAIRADEAQASGESWGPLHGVPMTIKDSLDTANLISTGGTLGRANFVPERDATVVRRALEAGAILLGKTNTPELTLSYETNNLVYGRTNSPWDLERTPGGSSGGAGAIVACGGAAFDIGSDYGGSIRLPASTASPASSRHTAASRAPGTSSRLAVRTTRSSSSGRWRATWKTSCCCCPSSWGRTTSTPRSSPCRSAIRARSILRHFVWASTRTTGSARRRRRRRRWCEPRRKRWRRWARPSVRTVQMA